jgi:hypothetical protein
MPDGIDASEYEVAGHRTTLRWQDGADGILRNATRGERPGGET